MHRFWKWIWIAAIPLVITAIVIVLVAWQPSSEEEQWDAGEQTYYFDSSVADGDKRLQNSFVNNSATNFFVQGQRLQTEIYTEHNTAPPYSKSFVEHYRRRSKQTDTSSRTMGQWLYVETQAVETSDGTTPTGKVYQAGERIAYLETYCIGKDYYYRLGEQRFVPVGCAQRICKRTALEGTMWHPYTVNINQKQYLSFAQAGESLYLYFSSDNEFISLFLSGLPEGSSWELYDHTYRKIGGRYCNTATAEIYHRATRAGRFLLRITSSAPADVQMTFHRDNNEWQNNMTVVQLDENYSGVFDYYGDEDYYILSESIADNLSEMALYLGGVDADLQVMAYDKNKNLIGRYTRKRGISEQIVLYGLEDVYAISVRTVNGDAGQTKYNLKFYYIDVYLLGLETYGFKISSPIEIGKDGENYYTAVCDGLTGKRIQDVQTVGNNKVTMTLTSAAGVAYSFREGEDMPLHSGKNTIRICIENPRDARVLTLCITDKNSYQLGYGFVLRNNAAVYSQALTGASVVAYLKKGDRILLSGQVQNGMHKVELADGSGKSGWIQEYQIFADYEKCAMPAAYASSIHKLQQKHPKWKFTFVRVGETLDAAVLAESKQHPIIADSSWRTPSMQEIRYYMNPVNFLNEQDIFMFEKQTYQEGAYSKQGVAEVWKETDGALASEGYYVDCFLEAGKVAGLSPYFIAARASLESGNGTSKLATGRIGGYEGYYNFFGINAVDSNPAQGAVYAKEKNWYTQRISIVEGAVWMKSQYISVLQYTPYFIKYSFVPDRAWHQYMTDIAAPLSDARGCYRAHRAGGTLNSEIEFVIPVFE